MELDLTPTITKSGDDETELDTPPHTDAQSIKNHHPPPPPAYKECMKNHAANIGGHAVDGCGEYMPPPTDVPTDPTSLICAACGCHRNFHRREPVSPTTAITPPFLDFRHPDHVSSPSPPFRYATHTHTLLSLSTAVAAEEHHQEPVTPTVEINPRGRKRFRTRFSHEQKEKMFSFSGKLGWKMHKSDEAAVEEFCRDIGVAKGVLRVWMHNNKSTIGRKERTGAGSGGGLSSFEKSINGGSGENEEIRKNEEDDDDNGGRFQNESGGGLHFHDSNNGSCSSA